MMRIASNELNISLKLTPSFIGVFEHFYDDSAYQDVLINYVNLAYEIEIEETLNLPTEQHNGSLLTSYQKVNKCTNT